MTPTTVAALLGDPGTVADRLLPDVTGRRALAPTVLGPLRDRVGDAVAGLLDMGLGDLLLDGWTRYGELRDAAQRSLDAPGTEERVPLHDHRVVSTHRPRVEIWVDGALVTTVELDVEVSFTVHVADAVVRDGRLVELGAGDVDVGARLSAGDRTLAEREVACPVGALVGLGNGVPLLGEAREPVRAGEPVREPGADGGGSPVRPRRLAVVAALLVVVLAAGGVVAVAVPASAWPWASGGVGGAVVPGSGWNMRAGPSARAAVVDAVGPGQPVEVLCVRSGWARLLEPRDGVYVDRRGLRLDREPPPCP